MVDTQARYTDTYLQTKDAIGLYSVPHFSGCQSQPLVAIGTNTKIATIGSRRGDIPVREAMTSDDVCHLDW